MGLTTQYSPRNIHLYVVDNGGHLSFTADFPHVGAYIREQDTGRLQRLMRYLVQLLERRQVVLGYARQDNIQEYNAQHLEGETLPHVIVMFDNFGELRNDPLFTRPLESLLRNGHHYGIHLVITSMSLREIGNSIYSLLSNRFVLRLADNEEFAQLIGPDLQPTANSGRGYTMRNREITQFQVALPILLDQKDTSSGISAVSKLSRIADAMKTEWGNKPTPHPIRLLPNKITLRELPKYKISNKQTQFAIGIKDQELQSFVVDCEYPFSHLMVIGEPLTGRTTTLQTIILSLILQNSPSDLAIILVDPLQRIWHYRGEHNLGQLPHVLGTYSTIILDNKIVDFNDVRKVVITSEQENKEPDLVHDITLKELIKVRSQVQFWIILDNVDLLDYKETQELADYLRRARPENVHIVATMERMNSDRQLATQLMSSRRIISHSVVSAENIGTRLPSDYRSITLVPGRAFAIFDGQLNMIQIAQPAPDNDTLDNIIESVIKENNPTSSPEFELSIRDDIEIVNLLFSRTQATLYDFRSDSWVGLNSDSFYNEMEADVLPMINRFRSELEKIEFELQRINLLGKQSENQ